MDLLLLVVIGLPFALWATASYLTHKSTKLESTITVSNTQLSHAEQLEISRQEWATYAASIVQELNRANGIIQSIDDEKKQLAKPYVVRKCKKTRTVKSKK
jgi:hypothetical protein